MAWYGIFLIKKLKLAFYLRRTNQENLYDYFEALDRFFDKYDKLEEDIKYVQMRAEGTKHFSAKTIAKMFNIIDELGYLPELSFPKYLLYFLNKFGFEIEYKSEDEIDLDKLEKKGWKIIET